MIKTNIVQLCGQWKLLWAGGLANPLAHQVVGFTVHPLDQNCENRIIFTHSTSIIFLVYFTTHQNQVIGRVKQLE